MGGGAGGCSHILLMALWLRCGPMNYGATWLLQAGFPVAPDACVYAAGAGDVDMMLWLVQEVGCLWGEDIFATVMRSWRWRGPGSRDGLLQVVRRLVGAGCPPDTCGSTLDIAARQGHLPLLRYLHEECGAGFGPGTLAAAAESGSEVVVEWLVGKGCAPGPGWECDPYLAAGQGGDMPMLACLRRLGVPWSERVLWWAVKGTDMRLRTLRWLVEQGAPWDERAVEKAIRRASMSAWEAEAVAWFEARLGRGK